jgi:hypothetical protein
MGINGQFGESNCSFEGDEQYKLPYSFEPTLVGLFDPNRFYQTARLNALLYYICKVCTNALLTFVLSKQIITFGKQLNFINC